MCAIMGAESGGNEIKEERVKALASMLSERPVGLGRPIEDRSAWTRLAEEPGCNRIVTQAERLLRQPLPEQPDELYLDFSRTGNRTRWQNVAFERRGRLTTFVLAECLEHRGRFLPKLEELIGALCAERTWVLPAHDKTLANFQGATIDIDLASSALAWNLATADWLLADHLSSSTRKLIRENVRRRVLDPFLAMVTGKRKPNWWLSATNNWNAVCLAGVIGAALCQAESRDERAMFVAAAETYSQNFLAGFTPDGYCSEGVGYWNYGFGHYVMLAESIRQATAGGVDLLALDQVRMPACFAPRLHIMNGVWPAFADCRVDARPDRALMWFVNRRFGLGLREYEQLDSRSALESLSKAMIYLFPNAATAAAPASSTAPDSGVRDWFEHAGVLVCRPAPNSMCRLGAALKGGHNAEHHNHNDLGSYVVVIGKRAILLDPGVETYTARTFSPRRYESKLLNSYGHPVPIVARQLQRSGSEARAKVLRAEFADEADILELDITSAYLCPELKNLTRTFVYSREGIGSLTITDHVEFNSPQQFGTALITLGTCEQPEPSSLIITYMDEKARVEIETGGLMFALEKEEIREDAPVRPTRIGINLAEPTTKARISVKITPFSQ